MTASNERSVASRPRNDLCDAIVSRRQEEGDRLRQGMELGVVRHSGGTGTRNLGHLSARLQFGGATVAVPRRAFTSST
jgi:hypothetical protein